MPVTPDRPDAEDRPSSADEARETVPLDPGQRPTVRVGVRPAAPERETVSLSRETVQLGRPGERPAAGDDHDAGDDRETVVVPRQREQGGRAGGRAPVVVAAAFATLWAAVLSWLPVTVVMGLAQLAEDTGSPLGAARAGLAGWLLGHGVPLTTPLGPLGIAPLLLTALIAWRLVRAGIHVTRAVGARRSGRVRDAALVAAAVGAAYAALGALAAVLVGNAGAGRAAVTLAGFGAVFGFAGAMRGTHAVRAVARRTRPVLRHGLRTGTVAALLLVAAGAATLGLSTALGGGQAADLIGAYRTGVAGQAGITLVSLAFAPNAAVWATAYLLGPGFAVGAGTEISLTDVAVGPLPAVPLVAGLPDGPVGGPGAALLAVPVLAAAVAGWLLGRRLQRPRTTPNGRVTPEPARWSLLLGAAAVAGVSGGAILGVAAWLSSGPLAGGRLSEMGPVPWQTAAFAAVVIALGALLGAAAARTFGAPRT
ncbi:cell division protein PerM [Spirilliplanes yamanashiensis]|uniref:Integral membrane protein n=1 Tax=Spirilliplanes yamanashiensis TaxID=42233 RepID=A0A8J4DKN7_9ACTN|nr:DUF6350 family protein [Spirilliplanes yamanashiensis]MDP9815988.1 hypothetical protein [Spirilliplanes yamanashiensis]GIJ04245.1 hypothetical protein Sya03_35970 [Spirilliplanes yamanashiensis]